MCQEVWPDELLPDLYFLVVNLGFQYLVPLSIILCFYMLLMVKIWRRRIPVFHTACRRETSTDTVDQWNARIVEQSKMKVLKMLIVIVSLFALSWLPLYLVFLHYKFGSYDEDSYFGNKRFFYNFLLINIFVYFADNFIISITPLAQWLGASNSCINPTIYFFFNANFRQYLKKALTRSLLCSSSLEFTRNHIYGNYQANNNHNNVHIHTANGHHLNNNSTFANGHNQQKGKASGLLNGASALLVASNTNINNLHSNNNSINHNVAVTLNEATQPAAPVSNAKSSLGIVAEQVDATLRPLYCCQNGKASPSPPPATLNTSLKLCYDELCEDQNSNSSLQAVSIIARFNGAASINCTSPVKSCLTQNVDATSPLKSTMHSNTTENIKTMIQFAAHSHKTLFPPMFGRETPV